MKTQYQCTLPPPLAQSSWRILAAMRKAEKLRCAMMDPHTDASRAGLVCICGRWTAVPGGEEDQDRDD